METVRLGHRQSQQQTWTGMEMLGKALPRSGRAFWSDTKPSWSQRSSAGAAPQHCPQRHRPLRLSPCGFRGTKLWPGSSSSLIPISSMPTVPGRAAPGGRAQRPGGSPLCRDRTVTPLSHREAPGATSLSDSGKSGRRDRQNYGIKPIRCGWATPPDHS